MFKEVHRLLSSHGGPQRLFLFLFFFFWPRTSVRGRGAGR